MVSFADISDRANKHRSTWWDLIKHHAYEDEFVFPISVSYLTI